MPNRETDIAEFYLYVTKAVLNKDELDPNKQRRIALSASDTEPDLYDERMSKELFYDMKYRIYSNTPIPEEFKSAVCEDFWCGGMPYLSIAHYPAGSDGKNVPGTVEKIEVDGKYLKSSAYLHDTPLGRNLFDSLRKDIEQKSLSSDTEFKPVRVSIGFLDLEHEHISDGKTVTFTRKARGQVCPLCKAGTGSKIYKKGHLVHLAATRVPVNPRTEMSLEEKSMGDIITKKDDAASIVGEDLAEDLEAKSLADDVLVVKAEEIGTMPAAIPSQIDGGMVNSPSKEAFADCYDPNTDAFDQACVNTKMAQFMVDMRNSMNTVKSVAIESMSADGVNKSIEKLQASPVVEESMDKVKMHDKEEEEEVAEDKKETKEELKGKSEVAPIDAAFAQLKSLLGSNPTVEQVQTAYASLGKEVEKAYTPPAPSASDIEAIVRSAVEAAVKPLAIELAQFKAQGVQVTQSQDNPISRALSLRPAELLEKSGAQAPARKFSQIEMLARKSTGASL